MSRFWHHFNHWVLAGFRNADPFLLHTLCTFPECLDRMSITIFWQVDSGFIVRLNLEESFWTCCFWLGRCVFFTKATLGASKHSTRRRYLIWGAVRSVMLLDYMSMQHDLQMIMICLPVFRDVWLILAQISAIDNMALPQLLFHHPYMQHYVLFRCTSTWNTSSSKFTFFTPINSQFSIESTIGMLEIPPMEDQEVASSWGDARDAVPRTTSMSSFCPLTTWSSKVEKQLKTYFEQQLIELHKKSTFWPTMISRFSVVCLLSPQLH